jgi:ubiquinone/menaquinone biosynthesis C-methylase UbiE
MDEWIPPAIRDSRFLMYPVYRFLYGKKNYNLQMHFKSHAHELNEEQMNEFYSISDIVSRNRDTDLCESHVKEILKIMSTESGRVADIGCGKGYLLNRLNIENPKLELYGVDTNNKIKNESISFVLGVLPNLPFEDNTFDTVICTHTVEHVLEVEQVFKELVRITKNRLIIVTPRQRYHYYTFDGHVNFFYSVSDFLRYIKLPHFSLNIIDGDWIYIGYKK